MNRNQDGEPLVTAAEKLSAMLTDYDRAAHALLRQKLDSRKNLAKAADLLGEVASAEELLSGEVGALVHAIAAARDRQQALAAEVQQRATEVLARKEALESIIGAFQEIAREVGALGDIAIDGDGADALAALLARVGELSDRARAFASDAQARGFDDMAAEGHALREQLLAIQRNAQRRQAKN